MKSPGGVFNWLHFLCLISYSFLYSFSYLVLLNSL